jgi:hypothetical protein
MADWAAIASLVVPSNVVPKPYSDVFHRPRFVRYRTSGRISIHHSQFEVAIVGLPGERFESDADVKAC